jgi:hypothetical protein
MGHYDSVCGTGAVMSGTFRTLRQGTTEQELLDTLQRIIAGLDAGEYPLLAAEQRTYDFNLFGSEIRA